MTEPQEATLEPGQNGDTQYDWVDKEVAAEVLEHAQAMIAAQIASVDEMNSKLTTMLSQAVQIATIAFGAGTLPLAEKSWMPLWAGMALITAGLCASGAAFVAWRGLRIQSWAMPGLSPEKTSFPSVLKAKPQTAMMLMAWAYQVGITANREKAAELERSLSDSRTLLIVTPGVGLVVAAFAWYLFSIV